MKPENLLVFMDYSVKLGDFGVSLNFNDSENGSYLKGYTHDYTSHELRTKCELQEPVEAADLKKFDRFALMKTFNRILK